MRRSVRTSATCSREIPVFMNTNSFNVSFYLLCFATRLSQWAWSRMFRFSSCLSTSVGGMRSKMLRSSRTPNAYVHFESQECYRIEQNKNVYIAHEWTEKRMVILNCIENRVACAPQHVVSFRYFFMRKRRMRDWPNGKMRDAPLVTYCKHQLFSLSRKIIRKFVNIVSNESVWEIRNLCNCKVSKSRRHRIESEINGIPGV